MVANKMADMSTLCSLLANVKVFSTKWCGQTELKYCIQASQGYMCVVPTLQSLARKVKFVR